MRLSALDLVDDDGISLEGLESALVGPRLGEMVAELSAFVFREPSPPARIDEILGPHRSDVLRSGLGALPRERLTALLRSPRSLMALQELVLAQGGPHWEKLLRTNEDVDQVERRWARLRDALQPARSATPAPARAPQRRWSHPALVSLATAACMGLALVGVDRMGPPLAVWRTPTPVAAPAIAWGWAKPNALDATQPAPAYLKSIAASADEWFKKRPEDGAGVAKRLSEFRLGCTTLLMAEHAPLNPETRAWLRERCQKWAEKLDAQRTTLESGGDAALVRAEVDAIVTMMMGVLEIKAAELQA